MFWFLHLPYNAALDHLVTPYMTVLYPHVLSTCPYGICTSKHCTLKRHLMHVLLCLLSMQVYAGMMSLGLSACICYLGTQLSVLWGMPSQSITIITGITVTAATLAAKQLAPLAPSAEGLALLMMQVMAFSPCGHQYMCHTPVLAAAQLELQSGHVARTSTHACGGVGHL